MHFFDECAPFAFDSSCGVCVSDVTAPGLSLSLSFSLSPPHSDTHTHAPTPARAHKRSEAAADAQRSPQCAERRRIDSTHTVVMPQRREYSPLFALSNSATGAAGAASFSPLDFTFTALLSFGEFGKDCRLRVMVRVCALFLDL